MPDHAQPEIAWACVRPEIPDRQIREEAGGVIVDERTGVEIVRVNIAAMGTHEAGTVMRAIFRALGGPYA